MYTAPTCPVDDLIFRVLDPQVPPPPPPSRVLGDYSLYRGWIISLQWSAPNRLSHWFSQSPGISSGKLASSEDSHGSRQARSADYGDSFTKLHFPRIPRKLAPITMGLALRGYSRRYYFIIRARARERASPSHKALVLFNLRNNTMIRRRAIRSVYTTWSRIFRRVSKVAANLLARIASFSTSRQFPRAFN